VDLYKAILSIIGLIALFLYIVCVVAMIASAIAVIMSSNLIDVAVNAIKAAVSGGLILYLNRLLVTIEEELKEEDDN